MVVLVMPLWAESSGRVIIVVGVEEFGLGLGLILIFSKRSIL